MTGCNERFALAAGLLVAALGATVLFGWAFGIETLKSLAPHDAKMQPLTALGLLVGGTGLAALSAGFGNAARAGGAFVLLSGIQSLVQDAFGFDFGTDRLLFPREIETVAMAYPGRMAPASAVGFVLLGCCLIQKCRSRNGGSAVGLLGLMLVSVPLLGYLYSENNLYALGPYLTMAVHTAGGFAVLFAALLALCPPDWLLSLGGRGPGGTTARRLIPAIVGVPVAAGWLALEAADAGLFPERLATALVVLATTVMLTLVVIRFAAHLDRSDAARREDYEKLRLAIEGASLGTWEVDLATGVARGSDRFAAMCGLDGRLDGGALEDWLENLHPGDRDRVLASLRNATREPSRRFRGEYRVAQPDGDWCWISSEGRVLCDAAGQPCRALGITQDITEAKHWEQRQELLLREVNHRVKNSLQLVNSLLGMQGRQFADPETRRRFEEAAGRVRAISHLHERLYRGTDVERVDFDVYLRALCDDLGATAPEFAIRVEADPVLLPTDGAVPLGLIVTELVTNAIKHSNPSEGRRLIEVRFGALPGGDLELAVRDHGAGLPPGFTPDQTGGSLGMRVIKGLSLQLQASLRTEDARPGARWILRIPPLSRPAPREVPAEVMRGR
ncbi:PAS domain-containing protein [Skermanella sp. TT6]|uniref:histidine kinase n=1 Tax=Skermanella cutis TaxID=2775420 RepID=A0ABX7B702_9PROT|nr:histidine kinase dimerization/phosphoacceptor domain -containing protein [Skermanella sp. TT6]QQP90112.1 PAS domain-containing protein [Skermanella sp. TT6]